MFLFLKNIAEINIIVSTATNIEIRRTEKNRKEQNFFKKK